MKSVKFEQRQLTPHLAKYREIFGHLPSPEALKFRTTEQLEDLAEMALNKGKPIKAWEDRPNIKTGTILDDLYS